MLHFITEIISTNNFSIVCVFNNNEIREINFNQFLETKKTSSFYSQLLNKDYFNKVQLDSYGTLSWENKIDFCPDVLYNLSKPFNEQTTTHTTN